MPFSVLVQRQFSLRTVTKARDAVVAGKTLGMATKPTRKRQSNPTMSGRLDVDRVPIPAWVNHLESFRHRAFCTTSPTQTPSTILLSSTARSPVANKVLHASVLNTTNGSSITQTRQCKTSVQYIKDVEELVQGNKVFREETLTSHPLFFEESAKGQKPPYMLIDCSDSRVAEQAIFHAQPGTMFTSGSIANQFHEWDLNSNSVLSYAVETLGVRHVIVMGHYGCGGVAASMLPVSLPLERPAHIAVQTWIQPIRELYQRSTRPEIVAHRNKNKHAPLTELPGLHDPAFRALVEENVKANVNRIARSYVMRDHYASLLQPSSPTSSEPPTPSQSTQETIPNTSILKSTHVFIHGWVYDLENGEVTDLNVTVGPPGREIPKSPWPRTEERERERRAKREA